MALFLQYRLGRPFILLYIVPLCGVVEPSLTFILKLLLALLHCQTGGVENHMYQLSQCLIKQGHKVDYGLGNSTARFQVLTNFCSIRASCQRSGRTFSWGGGGIPGKSWQAFAL